MIAIHSNNDKRRKNERVNNSTELAKKECNFKNGSMKDLLVTITS